jgi:hypothetical protein
MIHAMRSPGGGGPKKLHSISSLRDFTRRNRRALAAFAEKNPVA